jgi:hypothetical protein
MITGLNKLSKNTEYANPLDVPGKAYLRREHLGNSHVTGITFHSFWVNWFE